MFTHINPPELPNIVQVNKANGKCYYSLPNGVEYPTVSTVLNKTTKTDEKNWREMLTPQKKNNKNKHVVDRHNIMQEMVRKYLNNVTIINREYKPIDISNFNKLRLPLNNIDNIHTLNVKVYSETLKLVGNVNCVAEYHKVLSVINFYTATNHKVKDIISDYFKESTAAAIAWFEHTGDPIEDITIIIAAENALMPLIFTDKIANWIPKLLNDIAIFNATNK